MSVNRISLEQISQSYNCTWTELITHCVCKLRNIIWHFIIAFTPINRWTTRFKINPHINSLPRKTHSMSRAAVKHCDYYKICRRKKSFIPLVGQKKNACKSITHIIKVYLNILSWVFFSSFVPIRCEIHRQTSFFLVE